MSMTDIERMARSHPAILEDAAEKRRRVQTWRQEQGFHAVILSRRDQFAWLTSGGDSRVLNNIETGVAHALITPNTLAAPDISYFISSMAFPGFKVKPPESKVIPFPTNTMGALFLSALL